MVLAKHIYYQIVKQKNSCANHLLQYHQISRTMSFSLTEDDRDIDIRLPEDCSPKTHTITDFRYCSVNRIISRCDECGKYFSASRSLILHKKIHTGVRPFTCPVEGCGKSFYVNAQLVRHSFSHSNLRTEKCP